MTDWIKHDGKGMPVDGNTLVTVRFRDGREEKEHLNAFWWSPIAGSRDHWTHTGHPADIIAYRVHTPSSEVSV